MKILITGGTGFIGLNLCKEMIKNRHEVTVITRPTSKRKSILPREIKVIELSLDRLDELKGEYDLFYHLAWNGSVGNDRNSFEMQYSNIKYTVEAIKAAKRCGCTKFIGAGSQAEYGVVHGIAKEDETVCKPFMMYGAAKLATYHIGKIIAKEEGISFVWPRIYSVYGPGQNEETLIAYLVKTLSKNKIAKLSKCDNMWNFMYIDDCTRCLRMLGENKETDGIYNIASMDTRLLKDFVNEVCESFNCETNVNFGYKIVDPEKTFNLNPDISRIKKIDSLKNVSFKSGIKNMIDFIKMKSI